MYGRKLCVRQKALCTAESSVHGTGKSYVPQSTAKGGQGRFGTYKALTSQKSQAKVPKKKCRFQRREPAYSPRIRLAPNSGALCLCREKRSVLGKTRSQRRQKRKPANSPRIRLRRILKFCAFAKKNRSFFDKPRLQRLPKRSSVPQEKALCRKSTA